MRIFLLLFALIFSNFVHSNAQRLFAVRVGAYVNATTTDFTALSSLGFVHATPAANDLSIVYSGRFDKAAVAEGVAQKLISMGYVNAEVVEVNLNAGTKGFVVQLLYQRGDRFVDWQRLSEAGDLFVIIEDINIKVVTGIFADRAAAQRNVSRIRSLGFNDAFVREENTARLHPIGVFETAQESRLAKGAATGLPQTYDMPVAKADPLPADNVYVAKRSSSRRSSVRALQNFLRSENLYTAEIDGIYGTGTENAIRSFERRDPTWAQYLAQARVVLREEFPVSADPLQQDLDNFLTDAAANARVQSSNEGIALGYRAFSLFVSSGPSEAVNGLMNMAIKQVYDNFSMGSIPPFEFQRKYDYPELDLLIQHLHFLHHEPRQTLAVPCWLFDRYRDASAGAYTGLSVISMDIEKVKRCNPVLRWESIQAMFLLANALSASGQTLAIPYFNALLMAVYPEGVSRAEMTELDEWQSAFERKLNASAGKNAMQKSYRLSYLLNRVYLEDHFTNLGFDDTQARYLAIRWLRNALIE